MTVSVMHVLGGLVAHGAELRVLELIRNSRSDEFRHHVFVLDRSLRDLESDFLTAGAQLYWARSVKLSGLDLAVTAREQKIDVLHSHVDLINGWAVSWARLAGVDTRISHMRSEKVATRTGSAAVFRDGALRALISINATHHLGVSPSALAAGFSPRHARSTDARVVLSGIDFHRLQAEPRRLPGKIVVLHVGRDVHVKNREAAVAALNACHKAGLDVSLYFVGETTADREAQLRALSEVHASKLVFLGVRHDVPALVRGADVLLSTSRAEGMPGTVLEAALVGTRVVASDIPSTRFLTGLLDGIRLVRLSSAPDDWAKAVGAQYRLGDISPVPMDLSNIREKFDAKCTVRNFESIWRGSKPCDHE